MVKRGLGKGLDALIPGDYQSEPSHGVQQIAINTISPNPSQPRNNIKQNSLDGLAKSIQEHGVLQPLIVTKNPSGDHYSLIAGERRLRAAKIAGLEFIPAIIRDATELEQLEIALIENIQREDLSPVEAALAYQKLNDEFGLSHEAISSSVGKSRTAVTNTLRLLKLPKEVLHTLQTNAISEGHARALLGLNTRKSQIAVLQTILKNNLNVRQTEELVRKFSGIKSGKQPKQPETSLEVKTLEDELRTILGTKVTLKNGKKGGTVIIHYYSVEELESLIDRFKTL